MSRRYSRRCYSLQDDGKTGQIIYRIIDRRAAGNDFWRARNRVTNRADADRVLRHWARLLNSHLAQLKKS